jgi:hypothetical protein
MTKHTFINYQDIDFDPRRIQTKLLCKASEIPQSLDHYASQGYYIIGIKIDTESPVAEILYDPTLSTPKPPDYIHNGIEGTDSDEEIPNLHEVKRQWRNIAFV